MFFTVNESTFKSSPREKRMFWYRVSIVKYLHLGPLHFYKVVYIIKYMRFFFFSFRAIFNINALGLASIDTPDTCDRLPGLVNKQIQVCKRNLEVMDSVSLGANLAIQECQNQFSNRRWNCTTVLSGPVFGRVLENGRYKRLRFKTANSVLKIEKFPGLSGPVNV